MKLMFKKKGFSNPSNLQKKLDVRCSQGAFRMRLLHTCSRDSPHCLWRGVTLYCGVVGFEKFKELPYLYHLHEGKFSCWENMVYLRQVFRMNISAYIIEARRSNCLQTAWTLIIDSSECSPCYAWKCRPDTTLFKEKDGWDPRYLIKSSQLFTPIWQSVMTYCR